MLDIIVVGAGPAGLATAIAARKAGLDYRVIEKGALVNSILHFPRNMVFFTTADLLEIGGLPFTSPYEKPTRAEALRYYRRVCDAFNLHVLLNEEVRSIDRRMVESDTEPAFQVSTRLADGREKYYRTRNVVLATGYYDQPNLLGIPGEDSPHVSHYYTEPHPYYRKQVVVVGGKNSAAEASLDLFRGGAHVTLVHRGGHLGDSIKYWVRPDIENRIKEGSIAARFQTRVVEIRPKTVVLETNEAHEEIAADAVFLLTGYHPDTDLLARAGVTVDDATLAPAHNPETLETDVRGLYVAGAVVSGKENNRVFIENGRFHGGIVVRAIQQRLGSGGAPEN